jgi:hypothetical protein
VLINPSESFDGLRTNGLEFEIIEKNPFMLSLSKHVPLFSAACYAEISKFRNWRGALW